MKKRLAFLVLTGMLMLSACSGKQPAQTTTQAPTTAATEAPSKAIEDAINLFKGDAIVDDNGKTEQLEGSEDGWQEDREKALKEATASGKKAPGDRFIRSKEEDVVRLVNSERKKAGLNELVLDETMMAGAEVRAQEQKTLFSHTRPDGRDCFTIFADLGIPGGYKGENVGCGGICDAPLIMNMWMNSEGHRKNIMNGNYNRIGVGYFESGNYGYWAQIFAN